jgi:hypothetical protein
VLDRIQSYFDGLADIVPAMAVQMSGAWSSKPQRRLVSSGGAQTRAVIDWRWGGSFASEVPLAGLAVLVTKRDFYWAKSLPPAPQPDVGVSAHGWANQIDSVSFTGSFHGAVAPVPHAPAEEPLPGALPLPSPSTSMESQSSAGRIWRDRQASGDAARAGPGSGRIDQPKTRRRTARETLPRQPPPSHRGHWRPSSWSPRATSDGSGSRSRVRGSNCRCGIAGRPQAMSVRTWRRPIHGSRVECGPGGQLRRSARSIGSAMAVASAGSAP